ncbi:ankyrin repeat domain protein [Colletotrichum tofieldiae]|nr:ankyrin repeat domain protein [Colletotrichum tofieldiae]
MTRLEMLPNELLLAIAESVKDIRGLASMAKMNRRLNVITTPLLYREEVRRKKHDALFYCADEGLLGVLELLRVAGQSFTARNIIIPEQSKINMRLLITEFESFGVQMAIRMAGWIDEGAIHRAVLKGQIDVVRWLISHGVLVNETSANLCKCDGGNGSSPSNPLHLALCRGQQEVAHILLANGAKIEELEPVISKTFWQNAIQGQNPATAMEFALSVASTHSEFVAGRAGGSMGDQEQINIALRGNFIKPTTELGISTVSTEKGASLFQAIAPIDTKKDIDGPIWQKGTVDANDTVQTEIPMNIDRSKSGSEQTERTVTEEYIISAVTTLLDPIACIEAYADSRRKEAVLGQKGNLERLEVCETLQSKGLKDHPPLRGTGWLYLAQCRLYSLQ